MSCQGSSGQERAGARGASSWLLSLNIQTDPLHGFMQAVTIILETRQWLLVLQWRAN